MKAMTLAFLSSSMICRRRSSNSPRYLVPATTPARSMATTRAPLRMGGTRPSTMAWARPSTMAVLPTPGSPMSTGLFLVRRARIWITRLISSWRPITGSSFPSRASLVRSRPYSSRKGVFTGFSRSRPSAMARTLQRMASTSLAKWLRMR